MPAAIKIKKGILYIEARGDLSLSQTLIEISELLSNQTENHKLHIMIYDNYSTFNAPRDQMQEIIKTFSERQELFTMNIAVVARSLFHYGLANMFAAYAGLSDWNVKTFRRIRPAILWLQTARKHNTPIIPIL